MAQEKKNAPSQWELQTALNTKTKEYEKLDKKFKDSLKSITSLRLELSNKSTEINKLKSDTSSLNKRLNEVKVTLP